MTRVTGYTQPSLVRGHKTPPGENRKRTSFIGHRFEKSFYIHLELSNKFSDHMMETFKNSISRMRTKLFVLNQLSILDLNPTDFVPLGEALTQFLYFYLCLPGSVGLQLWAEGEGGGGEGRRGVSILL